jgi:hypothetical protein
MGTVLHLRTIRLRSRGWGGGYRIRKWAPCSTSGPSDYRAEGSIRFNMAKSKLRQLVRLPWAAERGGGKKSEEIRGVCSNCTTTSNRGAQRSSLISSVASSGVTTRPCDAY